MFLFIYKFITDFVPFDTLLLGSCPIHFWFIHEHYIISMSSLIFILSTRISFLVLYFYFWYHLIVTSVSLLYDGWLFTDLLKRHRSRSRDGISPLLSSNSRGNHDCRDLNGGDKVNFPWARDRRTVCVRLCVILNYRSGVLSIFEQGEFLFFDKAIDHINYVDSGYRLCMYMKAENFVLKKSYLVKAKIIIDYL